MSYNIDTVQVLSSTAQIKAKDIIELLEGDNFPEDCFLNALRKPAMKALLKGDPDKLLDVEEFNWRGECSGSSFEYFRDNIIPLISGEAELVFVWEGGDSVSGMRIKDGTCKECQVEYKLSIEE
jgi:hypothetical protein